MNRKPRVIKNGIRNFKKEEIFKINYVPVIDEKNNLIDLKNLSTTSKIEFKIM